MANKWYTILEFYIQGKRVCEIARLLHMPHCFQNSKKIQEVLS